jgi:hypothetical protein
MTKTYKPRTGPGEDIAEAFRMLQVSNRQMGETIMALFRERDALRSALDILMPRRGEQAERTNP